MDAAGFSRFRKYSVQHHAKDLERFLPPYEALTQAEKEFSEMLPYGQDTAGNWLMAVVDPDEGTQVGVIWYLFEVTDGVKQAFLADLVIDEGSRGKGYAEAAIAGMESAARKNGCAEAVLWVYRDNTAALHLYEKTGYRVFREEASGMYMKKQLTAG